MSIFSYLPDFLVNVDGEKSGSGIEDGGQVTHEGGQHDSHHHTAHPVRQKAQNQIRICKVCTLI